MIFSRAAKYLKYSLLSRHKRGHGIHGPFVFDLVSRLFHNKIDPEIIRNIETVRKKMIVDHRSIVVNDLGSGPVNFTTNIRKVSDIVRYSSVPVKYGVLLSNLATEFGDPLILEFGTSFGISTMYMAAACPGVKVITIEGCKTISDIASVNFREAGLDNIDIITASFDEILPDIMKWKTKPGLVFIDGNHRKDPVLKYFKSISEVSDNKTVIIIDDIYNSTEMEEAWKEIQQSDRVTVTIDIFRMGIVFFRRGINHNNYIIRY
jgi:predicted O-methyltransferase YrrM